MADITEIYKQFKTTAELQQYCNSQYKTILELTKKLQLLEDENKHLKQLFDGSTVIVNKVDKYKEYSNEEAVCMEQIDRLKEVSTARELSYEEAKKLDIYTKLLLNIQSKKSQEDNGLSSINEADLLKSLENGKS